MAKDGTGRQPHSPIALPYSFTPSPLISLVVLISAGNSEVEVTESRNDVTLVQSA